VHAAASGTVATAGWNGGCGIMVDVDHGNGYHTWYCHPSKLDVVAGQLADHRAVAQHHDPVRAVDQLLQVRRDQQHGQPVAGQLVDQGLNLGLGADGSMWTL